MLIKEQALLSFFEKCADGSVGAYSEVIVPILTEGQDGQTRLAPFSKEKTCILDGFRSVDPTKILYYMPREKVLPVETSNKKRIVAGVKACDVKAMQVLDTALAGEDFVDPVYQAWREDTVLISTDCSSTAPTCHCTILGGTPYAESGFDLNLSKLGDSYIIQTGSEKGEAFLKFLEKNADVQKSNDADVKAVQDNRKKMADQVAAQNKDLERSDNYPNLRKDMDKEWPVASETCVGCGACTNICPTCYCLILNDETKAQQFVKVRGYDSCQWHGYARVAGGDSPRPKMSQRFRNRYLCKFLFMQSNFNQLGCTGCGRCTEACAGNIDFRKVVKRIVDGVEMAVVD
ncbi:4Fe-4S dicluster domain-containing protein [candidate division KSB1 bacterium]|nr:4Fe-4S dicluster domain-containing protein [candidate division KSB1 bacterium]